MIGATPLISSLFHDEPSVETLNRIGLEFNAVGNHEFDKGSADAAAPAARRLQDGRRQGRRQQLPGRQGRHAGALRRREVPVAVGQRHRHRHRPDAAAGLRRQALPGRAGGLHRHDAEGHAGHRRAHRRGRAGVPRRGRHRQRAGAEAARRRHRGHRRAGARGRRAERARCRTSTHARATWQGTPIARIVGQLDDAVDVVLSGHTHAAYNCRLPNAKGRRCR